MFSLLHFVHNYLMAVPFFKRTCLVLGLLVVFTAVRKVFRCLMQMLAPRQDIRSLGRWAILTGGTDGIGKAMAVELFKMGLDIFMIGRDEQKLKRTAEELREIETDSKNEVRVCCVDFSESGGSWYKKVEEQIRDLDVGVLVNCAGISYPHAMYYDETDPQLLDDLVSVNLRAVLRMTRMVYGGMRERKRGAIICVGSGASELPCEPLYAAYAAVKAGVESFCRNLQAECVSSNVLVQCHTPLLVVTKLSKCRKSSLTVLSPECYAKSAIRSIQKGRPWKQSTISPSCVHAHIIKLVNFLPANLWRSIRLPQTLAIRNKALKKKATAS